MPRPGPRRPLVAFKLDQDQVDRIDARAAEEGLLGHKGEPNRSEMIRRMLAYATEHMPAGWTPTD